MGHQVFHQTYLQRKGLIHLIEEMEEIENYLKRFDYSLID